VNSEEWNGSSWTEGDNMNAARRDGSLGAGGTQTAAIAAGGTGDENAAEEYNGSSWTSVTDLPANRSGMGVAGIQTNCIHFGGSAQNLEYDGTTWTAGGAPTTLGTARSSLPGSGTASAALGSGGNPGSPPWGNASTEEFNASVLTVTAGAWASGNAINTARFSNSGAGSSTAGVTFGGTPPTTGATEEFDGTSWTESGDLNNARFDLGGFGTQTAAVAVGGDPGNSYVEEYDGSSWTEVTNIPRNEAVMASLGTLTAGLLAGGSVMDGESFEYDGTNWTDGGALNTTRQYFDGCGTQTAAVAAGGWLSPGNSNATEEYNGTAWSNSNNLASARRAGRISGTQTAAILATGVGPTHTNVEGYDGTVWSTRPSTANGKRDAGRGDQGVTSESAWIAGGQAPGAPPGTSTVEIWTGDTTALNLKTITDS